MKRVTKKGEVIDIDTYEDFRHMRNILNKYNGRSLGEGYSLDCLRGNVNDYIQNYINKIPYKIITPITYDGEGLRIIQEHFGLWYEKDLARLRGSLCSYWIHDESGRNPRMHVSYSGYTMVTPGDFLLLILNPKINDPENNSLSLSQNIVMTSLETTVNEAYFTDKKIITQASRAVEILQGTTYNLHQLGKFVGKFNTKINTIKDDINSSFERKDKVRFIEAIEKFDTLTKFLLEDNQWSDIVDIAEEFAEELVEFDPEEYLTN